MIQIDDNFKSGWIKLFRSIEGHWLWPKNKPLTQFEAWIMILIEVNHVDEKVRIGNDFFTCKRGEKLYSLDTWAALFCWNKSKVRRFFNLLHRDSMIVLKSERKTTRITVCNYDTYQGERNTDETKMKRERNADETQMTPIKECKELKNDKNIVIEKIQKDFYQSLTPFVKEFGRDVLREFYEYWSEPNKSKTKIKFQLEKTWDTRLRLLRWAKNDFGKKKIEQATTKSSDLTKLYKKID
jgi:hypothetical protein